MTSDNDLLNEQIKMLERLSISEIYRWLDNRPRILPDVQRRLLALGKEEIDFLLAVNPSSTTETFAALIGKPYKGKMFESIILNAGATADAINMLIADLRDSGSTRTFFLAVRCTSELDQNLVDDVHLSIISTQTDPHGIALDLLLNSQHSSQTMIVNAFKRVNEIRSFVAVNEKAEIAKTLKNICVRIEDLPLEIVLDYHNGVYGSLGQLASYGRKELPESILRQALKDKKALKQLVLNPGLPDDMYMSLIKDCPELRRDLMFNSGLKSHYDLPLAFLRERAEIPDAQRRQSTLGAVTLVNAIRASVGEEYYETLADNWEGTAAEFLTAVRELEEHK